MIDFVLILGLLIIAALIIAYVGLDVDAKQIDDLDKVFEEKPKRKRIDKA
jgi:mannose/fructose/N-acetylgalactosamine-specific phosphotransferase system component IID